MAQAPKSMIGSTDDNIVASRHRGLTLSVINAFRRYDWAGMSEVPLGRSGRRADVVALDRNGRIIIVEVKASVQDFRGDKKWQDYLEYCDAFYFCVDTTFPFEEIPETCGLIIADLFDADIVREDRLGLSLSSARRRSLTLQIARLGAMRLRPTATPY